MKKVIFDRYSIRDTKKNENVNKGFTLVELIVVLVVLAILAAILVPALLGYIDKAKESQDMLKAKNMLQATQAVLTDYYAKDADLTYSYAAATSDFGKEVRKIADDDPYMVIIGVGTDGTQKGKEKYGESKHDQYTAYFVAYWEDKNEAPIFFNGREWSMDYPWGENESGAVANYFYVNGRRINLSFIFVANKSKESNPWNEIQKAVKKYGHSYSQSGTTK